MESNNTSSELLDGDRYTTHHNISQPEKEDDDNTQNLEPPPPETTSLGRNELMKAIQVVEKDSVEIAQSFTSLFDSLRSTLSQATRTSVDHMDCFSEAAGLLQECALDAATKGNRYINSCLRLNEEMRGIEKLAMQLKILRRNVDALDSAVNRLVRFP